MPENAPDSGGGGMSVPDRYVTENIERVTRDLAALGYVVLKEKSYRQAQERQRIAKVMEEHAVEDAEHAREWARDCLKDERYLRDRLTFVYGIARAHGATVEELGGCVDHPWPNKPVVTGGSTPEPDSAPATNAESERGE